jgi:hypothetical protein
LDEKHVQSLSDTLVAPLAKAMSTTEDNFTFELIGSRFFYKKKEIESYPFVEVLWFSRGKEVQQKAAMIITDHVKVVTNAPDVVVVFQALPEADYYENGNHF